MRAFWNVYFCAGVFKRLFLCRRVETFIFVQAFWPFIFVKPFWNVYFCAGVLKRSLKCLFLCRRFETFIFAQAFWNVLVKTAGVAIRANVQVNFGCFWKFDFKMRATMPENYNCLKKPLVQLVRGQPGSNAGWCRVMPGYIGTRAVMPTRHYCRVMAPCFMLGWFWPIIQAWHTCIVCMYVCMRVCMYVCMYLRMCTYVCTYTSTWIHTYICMCLFVCTYIHTHMHTYTHTHTYKYTYIQIHI